MPALYEAKCGDEERKADPSPPFAESAIGFGMTMGVAGEKEGAAVLRPYKCGTSRMPFRRQGKPAVQNR